MIIFKIYLRSMFRLNIVLFSSLLFYIFHNTVVHKPNNIQHIFRYIFAEATEVSNTIRYPLCAKHKDNIGRWEDFSTPLKPTVTIDEVERYFTSHGPGEAAKFSQIWLPQNCSYHRYTNNTLLKCIENIVLKKHSGDSNKAIRISMIGDSATRCVFCGLTRIFSGSEMFGPCSNQVCGVEGARPTSHQEYHRTIVVNFPDVHIQMSFIYIKTLHDNGLKNVIAEELKFRPYAMFINTGAWDFDNVARAHIGEKNWVSEEECKTNQTIEISKRRADNEVKKLVDEVSRLALFYGSQLYYRNNHHNARFGTLCADTLFESLLSGTNWQIWDNRGISSETRVWKEQCYDGFHFDRNKINSYYHHTTHVAFFRKKNWILPGQMEIQLAQSLLHTLFHPCSVLFSEGKL